MVVLRISGVEDTGGKRKASSSSVHWMPFTLAELVPMSLALRDVTIGLVELAFPETRLDWWLLNISIYYVVHSFFSQTICA